MSKTHLASIDIKNKLYIPCLPKKLRQTKNVITEMAQLYKTFTFLSGARFAKYKYVCTIKFCFLTSYSSRLSEGEGVGVQSGVHSSLCSSQSESHGDPVANHEWDQREWISTPLPIKNSVVNSCPFLTASRNTVIRTLCICRSHFVTYCE